MYLTENKQRLKGWGKKKRKTKMKKKKKKKKEKKKVEMACGNCHQLGGAELEPAPERRSARALIARTCISSAAM
jgi:hypothetical protein